MKRITKRIKQFQGFALIFDILYVILGLFAFLYLFSILIEPEVITDIVNENYNILGLVLTSRDVNFILTLLAGYLIVFIPLAVANTKKLLDKTNVEINEWDYRTQFLYAAFALVTGNIGGLVFRILAGIEIVRIVEVDRKERLELKRKKKEESKELAHTQHDLEAMNKRHFVMQIVRIAFTYTFLTLVALFIILPFYWMILTSLKTHHELTTATNPRFFIGMSEAQWVNFKVALTRFDFWRYMWNTVAVGILSMLGTVFTTILAAFAFSRLEFKGREFIFSLLLATMMIPGELYTITNYITVSDLGWIETWYALIIPFMTSVFYIFFLRQTFKQIPDTLYSAARVDGCSDFKYLTRVMVPIAKPTIITIVILSAIGSWNAYIWPQLVATEDANKLISVALRSTSFTIGQGSDARPVHNLQLAATTLVTVPLLIVFFALKKYIMSGIGRSGTKG
jgi:ABC-type glycerol-3-phosphate transport system permease component